MNTWQRKKSGTTTALLRLVLVAGLACRGFSDDLWQRQSIYQIITDRFFDGDPSNDNADGNYDPAGHRGTSVHGGDFKGIEQKLDYIKALGASAIWISPIVVNARGEFHGYAGRDFYKVDPQWGSLDDLRHMVRAAHARGILVIDDIVVNHGGDLIDSADSGYGKFKYPPDGYHLRFRDPNRTYPPPFDLNATNPTPESLFHNQGIIQNYNDSTQAELGELSGLDDFRTESEYVRARMAEVYQYWMRAAEFDGFRVDTVKHVEMGFWQSWCPSVRAFAAANGKPDFFMFGEVYDGSEKKCGSYTGTKAGGPFALDSVLDYPLYFRMKDIFARGMAATRQIEDHYAAIAANYDPAAQMRLVTFLDNHDQPRFLSRRQADHDAARLRQALVFLYTARGIPCLYYGTEQGFDGDTDPYDREDMFAGKFEHGPSLGDNFDMTHPLFLWVATLNNFRRIYPALETGDHMNLWCDQNGPGLLAYSRRLALGDAAATGGVRTQEVFVVLNTATAPQTLPPRPTGYPAGTRLENLLDPQEIITISGGAQTPPIEVPGVGAKIFVAEAQLRPLDPTVTRITPAHDATEVAAVGPRENGRIPNPVVIEFSKSMDTASVEAAFSTVPKAHGTFKWSAARDTMTFTPDGAGFPAQTMVAVRIEGTARDAAPGNSLHAAFESRFKTEMAGGH
jgi:glycosidase